MEDNDEKKSVFGKYGTIIISAIVVIAASITFFFAIFKFNSILHIINVTLYMLQPIILGLVFAYLINPLMKFFERLLTKIAVGRVKIIKKSSLQKIIRNFSIFISMIIILFLIGVLLMSVVPELIRSIKELVVSLPDYVNNGKDIIEKQINGNEFIAQVLDESAVYIQDFLNENVLPNLKLGIEKAASFVFDFVVLIKNLVIGIIVAFYTLNTKEKFQEHSKKIIYAFLNKETAVNFIDTIKHVDRIFGGYIVGKLIDSVIIGIITFIFMIIANMPYGVLISVVIGVTNIIPFFGPFIGAIPAVFIILLVDPVQAVIFIIFIFILQQIDGNIIGPNILGDRTGLSPFWILFAILLGGGMFGFLGMLIGVPLFAVFYYLFSKFIHERLQKKGIEIVDEEE